MRNITYFTPASNKMNKLAFQCLQLQKMQGVDCQYFWAKKYRNGARNIIKHITSDAGKYTAHDCVKELKKTTA